MEVSRHWRLQGQRYNLVGEVCPNCSKKLVHKRAICPHCASEAKTSVAKQSEVSAYAVYGLDNNTSKVLVVA